MSRSGLVLFNFLDSKGFQYRVHDTSTGVSREAPAGAQRINSSGVTASTRWTGVTSEAGRCHEHEVVLTAPDGTTTSLGSPVEGAAGFACAAGEGPDVTALGDDGTIAVEWPVRENGTWRRTAYAWSGGAWTRLAAPGPGAVAAATAAGRTVGHALALTGWFPHHAFVWQQGTSVDLGAGAAYDVNVHGKVVGACPFREGTAGRHACAWERGATTDLGALPGSDWATAYGVNAAGVVVGASEYVGWRGGSASRAVLFTEGRVVDLNDLVAVHSVVLAAALHVSESGVIAVRAWGPAGSLHGVLLPSGAPLDADRSWRENGTVLATGELASGLALDAENVYLVTGSWFGGMQVKSVPKSGGSVSTLFSADNGYTDGNLLVDDQHVWFDMGSCDGGSCEPSAVWRLPKRGGTPDWIGDGAEMDQRLALGNGRVYWARSAGTWTDEIVSIPTGGGPETIHADVELSSELAVRDGVVYYARTAWTSGWLYAYLHAEADGVSMLLAGPTNDFRGGAMDVDDASIYLSGDEGILRISRSGGAPEVLAPGFFARDLDVEGRLLHFVQPSELGEPGCIGRVAIDGGAPTCLDSGPFRYRSVVADESGVYFVRDAEIIRLPN